MNKKYYKTCLNCGNYYDKECMYYDKIINADDIEKDTDCKGYYCDWIWIPEELK